MIFSVDYDNMNIIKGKILVVREPFPFLFGKHFSKISRKSSHD